MSNHPILRFLRWHAQAISLGFALGGLLAALLWMPSALLAPRQSNNGAGPQPPSLEGSPLQPLPPGGGESEGVLALALEGVGYDAVERALADGTLHNLARLAARGVWTSGLVPPSESAPPGLPWVLSTGHVPLPRPSEEPGAARLPFGDQTDCSARGPSVGGTDPLWRRAKEAGQQTTLVFWPEKVPPECLDSVAVHIAGLVQDLPAARYEVRLSPAQEWQNLPESYSPPLQGVLRIADEEKERTRLYLLALDRRNDGHILYDHILLDSDRDAGEGGVMIRIGEWAEYPLLADEGSGAAFHLLSISGGRDPVATVYRSPSYHLWAQPPAVRTGLEREVGPPSPPPDLEAWRQGWLGREQLVEMARRHSRWLRQTVQYLHEEHPTGLTLVRWTPLETALEAFQEVARNGQPEPRDLLRQVDQELGLLFQSVDLSRTAVVVFSTHQAPSLLPGDDRAAGVGPGFLAAAGPGLQRGVRLGLWKVTDVAPFLAALLGLPASGPLSPSVERALIP
ncbi:MAG: hypothetical protein ACUVXG_08710 [Anaerolineae bacterium]